MSSAYQFPLPLVQSKRCSKCGETHSRDAFGPDKQAKDGKKSACRACCRAANLADYSRHREARQAKNREWCAAHDDERKAKNRQWRDAHREHLAAYRTTYQREHAEAERAYARRWVDEHREHVRRRDRERDPAQVRAKTARFRDRHRAELNAKARAYHRRTRQENPERLKANADRRRARVHGARVNDFTAAEWLLLRLFYGFRCAYCGCEPAQLTRDHVVPLARGGDHTLRNIAPACMSCNQRKAKRIWLPVWRYPTDQHWVDIERTLK